MPRVAFYVRISTDEDRQKFSLAAQRDRLEAHCKAQWGEGSRQEVCKRPQAAALRFDLVTFTPSS